MTGQGARQLPLPEPKAVEGGSPRAVHIRHYCWGCGTSRRFTLVRETTTEEVYSCDVCGAEKVEKVR